LKLHFQFPAPDESREAFILPNQQSGIHIISCTSWLDKLRLNGNRLEMTCGAPGKIIIAWPQSAGYPGIPDADKFKTSITKNTDSYIIKMDVSDANTSVIIE